MVGELFFLTAILLSGASGILNENNNVSRNSDNNLYNESSINYIDADSCINGTVKGFKSVDDIKDYLK